jgi:hypothetical protein
MKRCARVLFVTLFLLVCATGFALAEQTYMSCTFDDKPIDQPLGQGGTATGESSGYDPQMTVMVKATPFETSSIDVHNTDLVGNRNLYFNLSSAAVSSGIVVIIMDLWFYQTGPGWAPFMEFYSENWQSLLRLEVREDGSMVFTETIGGDAVGTLPSIPTGRSLPVLIAMNMDTDTYSAWVDQVQIVNDHPLTTAGTNYFRVQVASGWNCAVDNHFGIDQIRVVDTFTAVPTQRTTWGRVRSLFRD